MIVSFKPQPKLYRVTELLGQGTSALVFKGIYMDGGQNVPVAIKMINLDFSQSNIVQLQEETKVQRCCQHPNICPLYQSIIHKQFVLLVMPLLQVTPVQLLRTLQPNGFDETIIATIMYDALLGLQYMHEHSFIHRDLKLGNLLLNEAGDTLLADFGVSCVIQPFSNGVRSTFVGSPLYMAPEVANNQQYTNKCDVWSFGMCMYQLATGKLPCENQDAFAALLQIIQADAPRLPEKGKHSKLIIKVIQACLQKDPAERKTVQEILQMKFWAKRAPKQQIKDLIGEFLEARKKKKTKTYQDKLDQANAILQQDDEELEDVESDGPWKFGNVASEGSTDEVSYAHQRDGSVDIKSPSSPQSGIQFDEPEKVIAKSQNDHNTLQIRSSSEEAAADCPKTQLTQRKKQVQTNSQPQLKNSQTVNHECADACKPLENQSSKSTHKLHYTDQKHTEVPNDHFQQLGLRKTQSESRFRKHDDSSEMENKSNVGVDATIDHDIVIAEVQDLWTVLQTLRAENASLKEQNEKYKQKLKLFMENDQKG